MKYNKLVRDKIPEIIRKDGKIPATHEASEEEYWTKLKEKLSEEASEFLKDSNEEELADILEVIDSICDFKKIDKKLLEETKSKKKKERGGFGGRVILDEVENNNL